MKTLLKTLCNLDGVSGDEFAVRDFHERSGGAVADEEYDGVAVVRVGVEGAAGNVEGARAADGVAVAGVGLGGEDAAGDGRFFGCLNGACVSVL